MEFLLFEYFSEQSGMFTDDFRRLLSNRGLENKPHNLCIRLHTRLYVQMCIVEWEKSGMHNDGIPPLDQKEIDRQKTSNNARIKELINYGYVIVEDGYGDWDLVQI
jgi:hypothetical protein